MPRIGEGDQRNWHARLLATRRKVTAGAVAEKCDIEQQPPLFRIHRTKRYRSLGSGCQFAPPALGIGDVGGDSAD
jgi:hypothetical protein